MKPVIYQLVVRLFGNTNETRKKDGTLRENGCGRFADIDERALSSIRALGATHVWLTGVLRQATLTDYGWLGISADEPSVVKGRAGSFYAIRDYYDVCPDYAYFPQKRMLELEALIARIHAAGLGVLIDLVPNHVARGYGSVVHPERDFGLHDDPTRFFDPRNDFFYVTEPRGEGLRLERPAHWDPEGVTFSGRFAAEDGVGRRVPRVTGNNIVSNRPNASDWYETVKLNYGFDFADPGASRYEPMPSVWAKIDAILAYWQEKGVDGFRVDFAHWIPEEAWRFLLSRAKGRRPGTAFIAEAYENLPGLIGAGFDAVYHDAAYDTLKRIYLGRAMVRELDRLLGSLDGVVRGHYLHYLENHDERRIASPVVVGDDPDASGFGSARAGRHLAPILYLYSDGPILFFNGQEVGETGAGDEGFGGEDGRTTIFDYSAMPALARWVNGHLYDGGRLAPEERSLRAFYADLLALCQAPEVRGDGYWGLCYVSPGPIFAFARYQRAGGSLLVVVANFAHASSTTAPIRIPRDLAAAAGLSFDAELRVVRVLDEAGRADTLVARARQGALETQGFTAEVADQSTHVYRITA